MCGRVGVVWSRVVSLWRVVVCERACTLWLWVFAALVSGRLVACGLALGCLRPRGMFLAVRVSVWG